jgi:hypothetical protein
MNYKLQILDDTEIYSEISTPRELRRAMAFVAVSIMLLSAFLVLDSLIQDALLKGMYA